MARYYVLRSWPVRWRKGDEEPEVRCGGCHEWWPLSEPFWVRGPGSMRLCRACQKDRRATYDKQEQYRARKRAYYRENRDRILETLRQKRAA